MLCINTYRLLKSRVKVTAMMLVNLAWHFGDQMTKSNFHTTFCTLVTKIELLDPLIEGCVEQLLGVQHRYLS